MEAVGRRRFHVSVRSLMIAVAVSALALLPFLWVARQTALVRAQELVRWRRNAWRGPRRSQRYVAQVHAAQAQLGVEAAGPLALPKAGALLLGIGADLGGPRVNHAAFRHGQAKGLSVEFTLVNDGQATVDPKVGESRIVVNGDELTDLG